MLQRNKQSNNTLRGIKKLQELEYYGLPLVILSFCVEPPTVEVSLQIL